MNKSHSNHLRMDSLLEVWHNRTTSSHKKQEAAKEVFEYGLDYYAGHGPNAAMAVLADLLRSPASKLDVAWKSSSERIASAVTLRTFLMRLAMEWDAVRVNRKSKSWKSE
jgi:hypothetical protein